MEARAGEAAGGGVEDLRAPCPQNAARGTSSCLGAGYDSRAFRLDAARTA
ncbi:hypothetical protein OH779_02725 [Actinacidiphila glaucinigra]